MAIFSTHIYNLNKNILLINYLNNLIKIDDILPRQIQCFFSNVAPLLNMYTNKICEN